MTPDDLDALIERMRQPGPIDDTPGGYDRDNWPGQTAADRLADERADLEWDRRNR